MKPSASDAKISRNTPVCMMTIVRTSVIVFVILPVSFSMMAGCSRSAQSPSQASGSSDAVENQPVEEQPVQNQPVQNQPVQNQPVQKQPVQKQPVQKQPVQKQPRNPSELQEKASTERSFAEQLADVVSGANDAIRLEQTAVGREQLQLLVGQPKAALLRTLVLDAGVVSDADVNALTGLPGLQQLRLRHSPLSDVGLTDLAHGQFDNLLILNLPQARPTTASVKALGQLPRVRQLRIGGKQIDDAAVEELAQWPALESLHLIQPSLTEKSLETIARMDNLSSFYIDQCPLSDAAWEKLFTARPKLHVHIDQVHHDLDPM